MNEQRKYEAVWAEPIYRASAPGEGYASRFLGFAKPTQKHSIIDFGAGTGRGALAIYLGSGARVLMVDFAGNCLDDEVRESLSDRLIFRQHDLTQPLDERADYGYCTDVMEHLPPEHVDQVLANIVTAARQVYFVVSTREDRLGRLVGEPLHLTVQPHAWWKEKLESVGFRVDFEKEYPEGSEFWGSAYANGNDFAAIGSLNTDEQTISSNIWRNLQLGLQEISPHEVQPEARVILLAGGPSLNDFEQLIVEEGRAGTPIVTTNGTYNWLIERGIRPAAQVMLDARPFNRRFLAPLVAGCKYLICSQSDHETVSALPRDQTWIWHSGGSELVKAELDAWARQHEAGRQWWPVFGGTTVTSRAITLLAMLGFRQIEIYGWDSCLRDGAHHAYSQPENDSRHIFRIHVGGREFRCHPWMIVQANELTKLVRAIWGRIDDLKLCVHGDGLIAHMLATSAELAVLDAAPAAGV